MRWISNLSRQSVLPILLGISLTTFGLSVAILFYSMLEEKDDNNDRKKNSQIATSNRKKFCVEFKVPEKYISAIIGKGGATIKSIEKSTNTRIRVEKENLFCPDRSCYVESDNVDNIYSAQSMMQCIVNNLPDTETYELFVPFDISRRIFKKNWKGIEFAQEIQKTHGTKVIAETEPHKTETGLKRKVILQGTIEQIAPAIIQIEDKVQEEVESEAQLRLHIAASRLFNSKKLLSDNIDINTINELPNVKICELLVPHEACGIIIGRNGCTVQEMERSSGAKITIDNTANILEDNKRKVTVSGTVKEVELAIMQIEDKVKEANESRNELKPEFSVILKRMADFPYCTGTRTSTYNVSKLTLERDDSMEVYVSAMETPNLFWIQVMGPTSIDLQHLVYDMSKYYNEEENRKLHILKRITAGQMVAAKFKYDNMWYRAEVISAVTSSEYKVFFVDYGDLEIVSKDDILELRTDMLTLRLQAVECSLANVKPRESEWSSEANDKFAELTHLAKWNPLIAKVKGYKERPISYGGCRRQNSLIPCIELYDKGRNKDINVGDTLIQLGMAHIEEEIRSAVNSALPRDKCDLPFIPFLPDLYLD